MYELSTVTDQKANIINPDTVKEMIQYSEVGTWRWGKRCGGNYRGSNFLTDRVEYQDILSNTNETINGISVI